MTTTTTTTTTKPSPPTPKRCLITIGATAPFPTLIQTVLSAPFLTTLHRTNYTSLRIQYGAVGQRTFDDALWSLSPDGNDPLTVYGIEVSGFDFAREGLREEMVRVREGGGCVVSHAGSGSILDALRVAVPVLVVPNPELMDNHQVELAEVLEEQGYVVHGKLDELDQALVRVEELRRKMLVWPPVTAGGRGKKGGGLVKVVREEMGWVD